jgi:predicted AlkP superfamily pyrophosphatase or phosphodiesterase
MRSKRSRCGALVGVLVLGTILGIGCVLALPGHAGATRPQHVILVSVDGMAPDYYAAPERLGARVPNLTTLKSGGAYAEGVEGVYPTVTYPSHTTLVTGMRPAGHGIVQNRIFEAPTEPQTGAWYWYASAVRSETLWTEAHKAGKTVAAVGWPVTVGANVDYDVPEIYEPGEAPATWKRVAQHSTPGLLEKALGPDPEKAGSIDERVTTVSEFLVKTYRPNLLLVHLVELDAVQHRNGPRTTAAIEAAEREDGYVGRIVQATREAGIFDTTTFFIVSDHGFARIDRKFSPNVVLANEGLITLDGSGKATSWKAAAWPAGGSCALIVRDANDEETEAKVRSIFSNWVKRDHSPIRQVVSRAELRQMGAIPEAYLMLEAAPGFSFDDLVTGSAVHATNDSYRGTHGYLPTNPEMRAALIAYGVGIRPGTVLSLVRMIDIAPTIASLLDVNLPHAEGERIEAMLKE